MKVAEFVKGPWNEHEIPRQKLPCCGYEIDTISQTAGDKISSTDELLGSDDTHASVSVCMRCGQWLIINPDLTQRLMAADDIADMPDEIREQLRIMSQAVHVVREQKEPPTHRTGIVPSWLIIRKP